MGKVSAKEAKGKRVSAAKAQVRSATGPLGDVSDHEVVILRFGDLVNHPFVIEFSSEMGRAAEECGMSSTLQVALSMRFAHSVLHSYLAMIALVRPEAMEEAKTHLLSVIETVKQELAKFSVEEARKVHAQVIAAREAERVAMSQPPGQC